MTRKRFEWKLKNREIQFGDRTLLMGVLNLTPDLRVLGFTAAVSIATGILFGIAPALRATRIDLAPALKSLASLLTGSRVEREFRHTYDNLKRLVETGTARSPSIGAMSPTERGPARRGDAAASRADEETEPGSRLATT